MAEEPDHRIAVHLADFLLARGMTLVELSSRVGVTVANLSILKNSHAKAIRFHTLTAICDALGCTPGQGLSRNFVVRATTFSVASDDGGSRLGRSRMPASIWAN